MRRLVEVLKRKPYWSDHFIVLDLNAQLTANHLGNEAKTNRRIAVFDKPNVRPKEVSQRNTQAGFFPNLALSSLESILAKLKLTNRLIEYFTLGSPMRAHHQYLSVFLDDRSAGNHQAGRGKV